MATVFERAEVIAHREHVEESLTRLLMPSPAFKTDHGNALANICGEPAAEWRMMMASGFMASMFRAVSEGPTFLLRS